MKRIAIFFLFFALAIFAGNVHAQAIKEFRISAIPDENPQEMLRIYQPFADYLTKEIGMPVKFTPVVDYAATVEGLAANRLEMVWYGGLTSVQARSRPKARAESSCAKKTPSLRAISSPPKKAALNRSRISRARRLLSAASARPPVI